MALYVIGDTHLSLASNKPMDVFGSRWENYTEKLRDGFSALRKDDVCVIAGDISWGMSLEESRLDFQFIDGFPGKKIVLKGNHDYWWTTATKAYNFFEANGVSTISILNNNCYLYGDIALCGTRGWFVEEETGSEHDRKIMNREVLRLEASLKCAGDREKYVFLHYPPKYRDYECIEILDLLESYGVTKCFYGHIHSKGCAYAFEGAHRGTEHMLISADHLFFRPHKIID